MTELTLGQFLRQERENRGITIEQVASATKISVRLLHALESDQFPDLPATPFIRGFVTSYCRFVGMDERDILVRYRTFIDERSKDRPAKDSGHSGYAFEKKDAERSRAVLWTVMSGFVVLGGVMILLLRPALKHRRVSHIEQLRAAHSDQAATPAKAATPPQEVAAEPVTSQAAAISAAPAKPTEAAAPAPASVAVEVKKTEESTPKVEAASTEESDSDDAETAEAEVEDSKDPLNKGDDLNWTEVKHKIVFRSLENIWVRYLVDEKKLTQFMLLKGKLLVLKGKQAVRFQVSNPRAVEYRYGTPDYRLLAGAKDLATYNETATLVVPAQVRVNIKEPFPGLPPLSKTPDPGQGGASSASTSDG